MQQFHRLGTVLVILWFVLLAVVFLVVRPELAYSYGHWFHDLVGNLPVLTEVLSLPVLGPAFSSPTDGYSAGFWLAWGFLFLPPLQLVKHGGKDAPAGRADRMAERNARAVDVENIEAAVVLGPAPDFQAGQHLDRKSVV